MIAKKYQIFFLVSVIICSFSIDSRASQCFETTVKSPSPFMGNNDEIFQTLDGNVWQVKYAYEYLYEYYPSVMICDEAKLIISGKVIEIMKLGVTKSKSDQKSQINRPGIKVLMKPKGCRGYFLADGDYGGVYLLEWYGGYDPVVGDSIVGDIKSFGLKDVFYPERNMSGSVYVDDYSLTKSTAIEKLGRKCF